MSFTALNATQLAQAISEAHEHGKTPVITTDAPELVYCIIRAVSAIYEAINSDLKIKYNTKKSLAATMQVIEDSINCGVTITDRFVVVADTKFYCGDMPNRFAHIFAKRPYIKINDVAALMLTVKETGSIYQ